MKQDNSSGYRALREGAGLVDPVWIGRLLLTGADRRSYLQGLLTNDIDALKPGTGCYAAMLTAQGRMLTDMRVFELGDAILLTLPASATPAIRAHLDRFVITEDVQVQDVSESRAQIGVYGPRARDVVGRAGLQGSGAVIVRSDEPGVDGFDVFVDRSAAADARDALVNAGAVPASEADVETVRIESGRPKWGADLDADTIPLEAGLEDRAISRTKGCYVGQEVIVRVVDRGHGRVARRLVRMALDAEAAVPSPGTPIASGDREIGRITSAAWSPSLGHPIALGYVHRDFVEAGTKLTVGGAGAVVSPT